MNDSPNKRGIIVGIFIILGLVFLITGIMIIGNAHDTFQRKIKIVALFEDVNGLQKGSNIWFSGVKIGTVGEVKFYHRSHYHRSQVAIIMKIETQSKQFIRKDAKVKISTDGFIGNKILIIYDGSDAFGEVEEGDTLGVEKTFSTDDMINMLQENNKNFLSITNSFRNISKKLENGEGTLGKLLNDRTIYNNISDATQSLQAASIKAQQLISSLSLYSAALNKKGTLANQLVTDTIVYNSLKNSVLQLQHIADSTATFISELKTAANNPNSTIGILLHDEATGTHLKETIKNLEKSSVKLDQDLEALQHNILLRKFFKKKNSGQ